MHAQRQGALPCEESGPKPAEQSRTTKTPGLAYGTTGTRESRFPRIAFRLADAVMVILAAGMFGALIYAAVLVSDFLFSLGLVLGALGFGGLALVAMLGEVKP